MLVQDATVFEFCAKFCIKIRFLRKEAQNMFKIIIECGLEGRLWLTYPLFLFLGKLENPMQKLWATKKKEALFLWFWWQIWQHFLPNNWYLSITVHWRNNIDDKNPTNKVVVEGHYFLTCYYYILRIWSWKNSRYFPYFVKRFSINNSCCLDPLQIEDLISWSICLILKLCYKYNTVVILKKMLILF